jgi:rubredoxin
VKYKVGDSVWRAAFEPTTTYMTCPDCGGEARIRVILHDGTELSIECEGCRHGYDPADGRIKVHDRAPRAILSVVYGMEIDGDKVEYHVENSYRTAEDRLFDSEVEALECAREMAADADREERARYLQKEKPTKTWAWHVTYHRRAIREAERQIAYHTRQLNVARVKAKELA